MTGWVALLGGVALGVAGIAELVRSWRISERRTRAYLARELRGRT